MDHVNIARVFDGGATENGRPYFVMELVHGVAITKYCDDNHLSPRERLELFVPVCQAIQHAHQKGIIHRDIKPSNLFLVSATRSIKILDFGIARIQRGADDVTELTRTGMMIGSPLYMAPEQLRGTRDLDQRADVWSLGVVLYRLLCGTVPHPRDSIADLLITVCSEPAPPLRERAPWVPTSLAELVHRALAIDVDARLPSARAFADELRRWLPDGNEIRAEMIVGQPVQVPARAPAHTGSRPGARPVDPHSLELAAPVRIGPAKERAPVQRGYLFALGGAAAAAAAVVALRTHHPHADAPPPSPPPLTDSLDISPELANSLAGRWFQDARAHCNPMELRTLLAENPAPPGREGTAFEAACAALAGDLVLARDKITSLPAGDRAFGVWPMFGVAHPLADRHEGDPTIAAIMRLVIEFWPENYMALYHAGVTEFMTGDARAADHLHAFRRLHDGDGFAITADALLHDLAQPTHDCARVVATDPEGHAIRRCGP
jgi:hypothetical protein